MSLPNKIVIPIVALFACLIQPTIVRAQSPSTESCNADIDQNGFVDLSDYSLLVKDFFQPVLLNPRTNIDRDASNIVDLTDYSILVKWFFKNTTCTTPSPTPSSIPTASSTDWNQDAHDPQRTGTTSEEPATPWTYLWSFNGSDSTGGTGNHIYDAANEARTVVGAGKLFVPAGARGLYALTLSNGQTAWTMTTATFISAPVFDAATQYVYAGATDGKVYKFDATTGTLIGSFASGSKIRKTPLLTGTSLFVVNDAGNLYKIDTTTMQSAWVYAAGSRADTPPSYSPSRDVVIFAANNLNVYAVNNSTGTLKWKVKPTPNAPGGTTAGTKGGAGLKAQVDFGWPVIAEKHGVVFIRMQLDTQAHFEGPNSGKFATTNAENRAWLVANPQWRNLFALNLDTGVEKFIPASGYGSTEDVQIGTASTSYGVTGAQPIVKNYADGSEVVYLHFRNLQGSTTDFRWSGHMGEMVLDDTTIPGLVAGDFRFVQMDNAQVHIIDEQNPLTMAGNMLFHSHWSAVEGVKILDRSATKGLTKTAPITSTALPRIARSIKPCGSFSLTHFSTCTSLSYVTDGGRTILGPAFYSYWNVADPPGWSIGSGNTSGTSYSAGVLPRYTYTSNGYIIVEGNGGDILVLKHS